MVFAGDVGQPIASLFSAPATFMPGHRPAHELAAAEHAALFAGERRTRLSRQRMPARTRAIRAAPPSDESSSALVQLIERNDCDDGMSSG
jgi:hypothetical protein